jgi:hypothetical protein
MDSQVKWYMQLANAVMKDLCSFGIPKIIANYGRIELALSERVYCFCLYIGME